MAKKSIYKSEQGKRLVQEFYGSLLENWAVSSQHHYIDTHFGRTFVIESGIKTNPTILLLHGTGSNSAMWAGDVKMLLEKYHVYVIDIIGECGKSSENRPKFNNNNYAGWLNETVQKLEINKASVVACSLGGWIALDFFAKYPEKTEKLVLIATAGISQVKTSTILLILLTSITGSWGFNMLNKRVYGNLKIDKQTLEFAALIKKYFNPRTDVLSLFSDEQLNRVASPVLFIGGENDCFYNSFKTASRLSENVRFSKTVVLKNTGHVIVNQTEKIIKFLENGTGEK